MGWPSFHTSGSARDHSDELGSAPMSTRETDDWPFFDEMPAGRAERQQETIRTLPFFNLIGLRYEESRTDYVRLSLESRPDLAQPAGILHGGMHATLVDTAVAQAMVTTIKPGFSMVTIHLDTRYFKPTPRGRVFAEGRIIRKGKKIAHGEVDLTNEKGELIGKGSCVYAVLKNPG